LIGRLTGRVVEDSAEGTAIIDVAGVGYEVTVPLGALGRAPKDADGAVTLFVHTHVREDTFALYGFPTREDRAAFRALIGVSSIGPKIALALLGALPAGDLAAVLARGETARLTAVPGVGKKTAERLVLELKGKLAVGPTTATPAPAPPRLAPEGKADLLQPTEADRAVTALGTRVETEPLADLVRVALALLSSR
jgi:holliday junction DNA helicase RuvA